MEEQSANRADIALARLAATQEAMASTAQMHDLGLSRQAIYVRQRRGGLHRMHRGVYLVGVPRVTPRGRLWAAALACGGPDAAWISHLSAAAEWRLLEHVPRRVDVITTTGSRSSEAIRVQRSLSLDAQRDVTRRHGLPISTPSRILMDIAAGAPMSLLHTACREAAFRGHLDPGDIALRLETGPPGAAKLRTAIEHLAKTGPRRTKSQLERDFLALVDRYDIPPPLVNAPLLGYTVDFLWPEHKLVVETDGRNHLRPVVYESDRERDAVLQLHGLRSIRFTSLQIDERPRWVAETTLALLG